MYLENLVNDLTGTGGRKINSRACWPLLFMAALMTLLLLSQPALAQERQVDLTMRLVSHSYSIEATAGKDNIFFLEINNIGNKAITDIKLSSETPEGWIIDFNPREVDYLGPASIQTVDVNIQPPRNATRREHEVNFFAEANEIRKVQRFSVTVKTPLRLWVGAGVVLVVVVGFFSIYVRHGRQELAA